MKFETYRNTNKEYWWRLVIENGWVIAEGKEGYKKKSDMVNMIDRIREEVLLAPIVVLKEEPNV